MTNDILTPRPTSKNDLEAALKLLTETSQRRIAELEARAGTVSSPAAYAIPPATPFGLPKCTACDRQLSVGDGVIVWDFISPTDVNRREVSELRILCRDGCNAGYGSWYSTDTLQFADREAALWRLASMVFDYQLAPQHMATLIVLAWAVPNAATKEQRAKAAKDFKLRRGHGL